MGRATHRRTLKYGTNSRGEGKTCGECEATNGNDDRHGMAILALKLRITYPPLAHLTFPLYLVKRERFKEI